MRKLALFVATCGNRSSDGWFGRRLEKDRWPPRRSTRYDVQDRLERYETANDGWLIYGYTDHGDLETKTDAGGQTTYTYDAFGNLRTVVSPGSTVEYLIDGRNRRIGRKVDGVFTGGFPIAPYRGSGLPIR